MNIFFDYQIFSLQAFGGISRYYAELIAGINYTGNQAFVPLLFSNNAHLSEKGLGARQLMPNKNFYKKTQLVYRSNQIYTIAKLHQKTFDIFHATYYDPYFLPYLKKRPFVVTFLDMIHEKLISTFPDLGDGGILNKQKQLLANRADKIIAISESTKRDVIEYFNVDPAKIEVIYLGSSLKPSTTNIEVENCTTNPYLLFVGRRERYKNFKGLVSAIHPLLKKYNLDLLCAGGDPFTKDEQKFIHSFGIERLVKFCPINDQKLQQLYQQAVAFVFPSMYEGFGIPVLEAFACSCPCIVSNVSSLPEVAGDAALYINPISQESMINAVEEIVHNTHLRQALIANGHKRLGLFSWEQTTVETIRLYKTLCY